MFKLLISALKVFNKCSFFLIFELRFTILNLQVLCLELVEMILFEEKFWKKMYSIL